MYKVFVNDKRIVLTSSCDLEMMGNKMLYFRYDDFEEINFLLTLLDEHEEIRGAVVSSDDLESLITDFRAHFKEIDAAGGLVTDEEGRLLFIHRFGKWDLPKGKRETGETPEACALRETEEECGVKDLELGAALQVTYHTYILDGRRHLKRTFWYAMKASNQALTPQAEEGITAARWIAPEAIDWHTMPTYPNIRILVDEFLASTTARL